jgi:hypothetical protein
VLVQVLVVGAVLRQHPSLVAVRHPHTSPAAQHTKPHAAPIAADGRAQVLVAVTVGVLVTDPVDAPVEVVVPVADPVDAPVEVLVPVADPVDAPVELVVPVADPVGAPVEVAVAVSVRVMVLVAVLVVVAIPVVAIEAVLVAVLVTVRTSVPVTAPPPPPASIAASAVSRLLPAQLQTSHPRAAAAPILSVRKRLVAVRSILSAPSMHNGRVDKTKNPTPPQGVNQGG